MPVTLPQYKPQQLAKLSREELQSHLEVLQRQHAEVNTQRDELLRDVELLCQGMPSATFDPSSLLQERVRNAETELSRTKAKLRAVTSDLSDVTDDHAQMKEAKRISDRSAREVCPVTSAFKSRVLCACGCDVVSVNVASSLYMAVRQVVCNASCMQRKLSS